MLKNRKPLKGFGTLRHHTGQDQFAQCLKILRTVFYHGLKRIILSLDLMILLYDNQFRQNIAKSQEQGIDIMKPEIIYEDSELIVCIKPAGIATQSKRIGSPDMVSLKKSHCSQHKEQTASLPCRYSSFRPACHWTACLCENTFCSKRIKSPASVRRIWEILSHLAFRLPPFKRRRLHRLSCKRRTHKHFFRLRAWHSWSKKSRITL